jgi:hypothetical protein
LKRFFATLALSSLLPLAGSCGRSPEAVAEAAVAALCGPDPSGFDRSLTERSAKLLAGVRALRPDRFTCLQGCDPVASVVRSRGPVALVSVEGCAGVPDLVLVEEDGSWRIDIFLTESGLPPLDGEEAP